MNQNVTSNHSRTVTSTNTDTNNGDTSTTNTNSNNDPTTRDIASNHRNVMLPDVRTMDRKNALQSFVAAGFANNIDDSNNISRH